MTSSLVGSEMCIRDSTLWFKSGDTFELLVDLKRRGDLFHLTRTQFDLSVSYTHLTLPTICSV
eukprot:4250821-Prorocentrum_lima.AAC.1